jgi:hypothetical protein
MERLEDGCGDRIGWLSIRRAGEEDAGGKAK